MSSIRCKVCSRLVAYSPRFVDKDYDLLCPDCYLQTEDEVSHE